MLSTCSLVAGRTSVAVTTAPSRRAVAIACKPATPTPITNTFASGNRAGGGHHHRKGAIADAGVSAFAMELMPRITRAQVMDVLSSPANLAGYRAVIEAAEAFGRAML